MVDFTMDVYTMLHPDKEPPEALQGKRAEVRERLKFPSFSLIPTYKNMFQHFLEIPQIVKPYF